MSTNNGDTTYVWSASNNDVQTFGMQSAGVPVWSTINSVTLNAVVKEGIWVGSKKFALGVENGWTFNEGSDLTATNSYVTYSRVMTTNPLTTSAWTDTEVNSWTTKFGVSRTNGAWTIRVTQLYVVVDYTAPVCGDGLVNQESEACDDGNDSDSDACLTTCQIAVCGDGIVRAWVEACDDGNTDNTDSCTNACVVAICGDGIVKVWTEQCDDWNAVDGDGCLTTCQNAVCGDGIVQEWVEDCDDLNEVDSDACLTTCTTAECGDGVVRAWVESCDDANTTSGDGCDSSCIIEVPVVEPVCGSLTLNVDGEDAQVVLLDSLPVTFTYSNSRTLTVSENGGEYRLTYDVTSANIWQFKSIEGSLVINWGGEFTSINTTIPWVIGLETFWGPLGGDSANLTSSTTIDFDFRTLKSSKDTLGYVIDLDADDDGVADCTDVCINNAFETENGAPAIYNEVCTTSSAANYCGDAWIATWVIACDGSCTAETPSIPVALDTDGDEVADCNDNCINDANPEQTDSDEDGTGDACEVIVAPVCGDGIVNWEEECDYNEDAKQSLDSPILVSCSESCVRVCTQINETPEQVVTDNQNVEASNSNPISSLTLISGDTLTVSAVGMWRAGDSDDPFGREGTADGLEWYGDFNWFKYGSLVGRINGGSWFFVWSMYSQTVSESWILELIYWDSVYNDNSGQVAVTVTKTTPGSYEEVAVECPLDEPLCGNWYLDEGEDEQCDGDSMMYSKSIEWYCNERCEWVVNEYCGDGIVNNEGEQCDDGNDVDTDSCSNECITNTPSGGWQASSVWGSTPTGPQTLLETWPEDEGNVPTEATSETVIAACEEDTYILERLGKLKKLSMEIVEVIPSKYARKIWTKAIKLMNQLSSILRKTTDKEVKNDHIRALVCKIEIMKEARGLKHKNIGAQSNGNEVDYLLQYLQDLAILQFMK